MMQTMECDSVLVSLGNDTRRAVQRAIDGKTSAWLTVMPIACNHFDLSSVEFRDALSLRYHRPLLKTPGHCDGCGEEFSFQHALDCKKGGLVTQRHNEVRDALGDLVAIVYKDVVREPIVQEADDSSGRPALIADLSIRGVWQPQTAALLDVRVVDTDTQSYASCTVDAVLCSAEQEKKRKYSAAVEDRRASFTPFVVSVDGVLGHDAQHLMKRLCDQIVVKWEKSHSEVMGWVRARMAFAILRATNLCLRGSRGIQTQPRRLHFSSLATCLRTSAADTANPAITLASFKVEGFSADVMVKSNAAESSLNNAEETSVDDASSVEGDDRKRPQHHLQASVPPAPSPVLHQASTCGLHL
eukprot:Em0045g16a